MLKELRIENFAIIDDLDINFDAGFIIFTGETGAGKSIIIDAIEALSGERVDSTAIRKGADKAVLEATFIVPKELEAVIHEILKREDLLDNSETLILGREIKNQGRNIARVNGSSINLILLRELSELLLDVHGQSEHLSLLQVRHHLKLLDRYGDNMEVVEEYKQNYHKLQQIRKELKDLREKDADSYRQRDILAYQINEIKSARLTVGQDEELHQEHIRLANAQALAQHVQEALWFLEESPGESLTASDLIGKALNAIQAFQRIDPSQANVYEMTQEIADNLSVVSGHLNDYFDQIEHNPKRLVQVEERLQHIQTLKKKYGGSVQAVLEFAQAAQRDLETISNASDRTRELEEKEKVLLDLIQNQAQTLSNQRHKVAERLQVAIDSELEDLLMPNAFFRVDFSTKPDADGLILEDSRQVYFDADGFEHVEFLVAPNPGEGIKPLVKIASGGETSRLMLALKNVLAKADQTPTLIFDEIDQGIGGRAGAIVGHKLWALSKQHQVLCITHLSQLAAFGDQHFRVVKQVSDGRTKTYAKLIKGENRLVELAEMLGELSPATLQSAKDLVYTAHQMMAKKKQLSFAEESQE